MSLAGCICPEGDLNTVSNNECKEYRGAGKVAKLFFQKSLTSNAFVNATNGIEEANSWSGLADATGDTKVVITPFLNSVEFGEAEVVDGVENFEGATTKSGVRPPVVTCTIVDPKPEHVKAINSIGCSNTAGVYFVWSSDKITGNEIAESPATYIPIKISEGTFIGTPPQKASEFGSQFVYTFQFQIGADWYENSNIVEPQTGFSYLSDIAVS